MDVEDVNLRPKLEVASRYRIRAKLHKVDFQDS